MANTLRKKRLNQILYISIGSLVAVVILFIILLNIFSGNSKNNSVKVGESNNSAPVIEQANSRIGNSINDIQDNTSAENLAIELNDNSEEENLDNATLSANTDNDSSNNVESENEVQNVAQTNNEIIDSVDTETVSEPEVTPDPVFVKPVDGEIMKQYGKDKLLYSNTLKEWTTHLGIDIKANKTSIVKAASDGVVKSIKNDPRYGLTIVIEHDNGYASIYANLLSSEFVTVGEKVKSGQTIGTVGNSATFEILDEPHLHFEITKDGENVDPEMCIK